MAAKPGGMSHPAKYWKSAFLVCKGLHSCKHQTGGRGGENRCKSEDSEARN